MLAAGTALRGNVRDSPPVVSATRPTREPARSPVGCIVAPSRHTAAFIAAPGAAPANRRPNWSRCCPVLVVALRSVLTSLRAG